MIDLFEKCRKPSLASELKEKGIYPYFHALESRQAPEVVMEGRRRIMLGSNNYLGLTTCPEVIEAGIKAFEQYGTGCSGSRFLNGTLEMHLELEAELAKFLRKEAVVTFSTGFQSNLGIISAIVGRGDVVICDKENHASIYDGCKLSYGKMLRFDHADMEDLERQLQKVPQNAGCLIVTDGVFSMGGDIAKLPEIVRLAKQYGARVMVDDAHGLGVLGEGGRGTASHFGLEDEIDIYMGTFSKSLASLGGYMASSHEVAEYVRHASRPFIFSASITPASCATALAALRYLEAHPEIVDRLNALSAYARDGLRKKKVKIIESTTPIIPLYTYTVENTLTAARQLYDAGVYVNPVLPPATPPAECLLRTSYMATLTEPLIDEAVEIIGGVLPAIAMPVIILGGIYSGIFTPTQASGIAVIYGLILGVLVYREIKLKDIVKMFIESGITAASAMLIVSLADGFNWIITTNRVPKMLSDWFLGIFSSAAGILLALIVLLTIIGCFMSVNAAMIVLTPILVPVMRSFNVSPITLGIIMIICVSLGMVTPPFGVNLFVAAGIAKVPFDCMTKHAFILVGLCLAVLIAMVFIPGIITFLPSLLGMSL